MKLVSDFGWLTTLLILGIVLDVRGLSGRRKQNQANRRQTADFNAGGLPSHLPSPPEPAPPKPTMGSPALKKPNSFTTNMVSDEDEDGFYPYYYKEEGVMGPGMDPESTTVKESGEANDTSTDDEEEDDDPAPLGLDDTILILVPQFKYTLKGFPKWAGANVRMSLPITLFFEEMKWPSPPAPHSQRLSTGYGSLLFNAKFGKMKGRRKSRSILSLPPGDLIQGGERATLVPKLEKILGKFGIRTGRDCLLRAVCEVHEAELHLAYGFLGEILTHVFRISNSMFAETHLSSYLEAEMRGKTGNCSTYFSKCLHSLFEPAEIIGTCDKGSRDCGF